MFKQKITVPDINIEDILGIDDASFATPAKRTKFLDSAYYILYVITLQTTYREQKYLDFGYVPLYSKLLEKMLGKDNRTYLDALLESQILEQDDFYHQGKSYGYRISGEHDVEDFKIHEISTYVLVKKLWNHKNSRIVDGENHEKDSTALIDHLSSFFEGLSIDYEGALNKLQEIKAALIEEGKNRKATNVYCSCKFTLDTLHNKTYRRIFRDGTGRRLFTPITSLKRELREYLSFDGQKLVIMDIANSQPFFVNQLLTDSFSPSTFGMDFINDIEFIAFTSFAREDKRKAEDVQRYRALTSEGKLYDYLIEKLEGDFTFDDRYDFKNWFFKMFYSNNKTTFSKVGVMKKLMQKEFPTIYEYMHLFKEKHHANFPILMQRVESNIMLDIISTKIMNRNPSVPFFTIHDSILCLPENAEMIKKVMEEEIYSSTGVPPTVTME